MKFSNESKWLLYNAILTILFLGETVSGMKGELRAKQREADLLTERIDALERQIDQLRCGYEYDSVKRFANAELFFFQND